MKNFWTAFLLSIVSLSAHAQEADFNPLKIEKLGYIEEIQKPKCSDEAFQQKVAQVAEAYMSKQAMTSTIEKRRKFLRLKSLKNFTAEEVDGFLPSKNYRTANALIMVKINEHVPQKDIILCKQEGVRKNPVYVLMYPYLDNFKGYIINLDKKNPDYDAVTFIYP